MTIYVELQFRTESYAGQIWHRCSVYWEGRAMFGTGLYRDAAGARSDAMRYVDVMRAHVIPAAMDIVDGAGV